MKQNCTIPLKTHWTFIQIRFTLFFIIFLGLNVSCALPLQKEVNMDYGKIVTFKKDEAIRFSDFSLIYRGTQTQKVPEGVPMSNSIEQFEVISPSGKSKSLEWSSGTGDIGPTFFSVDSKEFELDLRSSPAVDDGKFNVMKDDQLVIRILKSLHVTQPSVTKESEKIDVSKFGNESLSIIQDDISIQYIPYSSGYQIISTPLNSYFQTIKNFHANKNIKEKGILFNSGNCLLGVWYIYDEQGKLIKEENYDLEYPFSIEKLLNFLIDQKIPLAKGVVTDGYNTKIIKTNEANRPCWIVKWLITPDKIEILTIDGETGKVIDREYMEYENS